MFIKAIAIGVAATALIPIPAIAEPGGGHGPAGGAGANISSGVQGPSSTAIESRMNSMGPANASPRAMERASPNSVLKTNGTTGTEMTTGTRIPSRTTTTTTTNPAAGVSQGPNRASPNGIAHANSRSVLAAGAVPSAQLPGLTTGLTVQSSTGTELGTVSRVVTGTDGSIRAVFVTSSTGQTFRLAPTTLSISGDVVTTTSATVGG